MKKRTGENHPKHSLRFEIRKTPYFNYSIYLKSNAQKYEFKN